MINKIDHLNIVVSDLEAATRFFCRLGFTITHRGDLEGDWIAAIVNLNEVKASYVQLAFQHSAVKLELIQYHIPAPGKGEKTGVPNRIGLRHIAFEVEGIEKIVSELKADGIRFFGDVQRYPETGKKLVYFYGPDDIILELAEYPAT